MRKDLQDFYSFLSEELKCENNGFYVIKEKKDSTIRHITIKKYGNFFVLKQKDGFKTGLFKEAIYSCDFIVVSYDKVYFVELKSVSDNTKYNNDTNPLDKALEQCKSSQLLFDYLCSAYNLQKSVNLNFENKQFIYLYPGKAIEEKKSTNMNKKFPLIPKAVECNNNGYIELDLDFFQKIG